MIDKNELERARYAFAQKEAQEIFEELRKVENNLWRDAAKRAKASGLYSDKTFVGDIQTGLYGKAGVRRRTMVRHEAGGNP